MSGQGIIYETSPFNAETTRPVLAEVKLGLVER
jgi:hypothetical protein